MKTHTHTITDSHKSPYIKVQIIIKNHNVIQNTQFKMHLMNSYKDHLQSKCYNLIGEDGIKAQE